MKKLLIAFVSILLLAGVAYATDWQTAVTADLSAANTGRSVATDSSVILKVWDAKSAMTNPGIGVSLGTAVIVYTNYTTGEGMTIDTSSTSYDTIGEIVDYINKFGSTSSSVTFKAIVGSDAYRSMPSSAMLLADILACGTTQETGAVTYSASSKRLSAGVEAKDGVTVRLKSIQCNIPVSSNVSGSDGVTLSVYDGNTRIWRKFFSNGTWNSTTAKDSSANTVTFPEGKGLAATKGKSLCAVASLDRNVDADTAGKAVNQISIVYDQYKD